MRWSKHFLEKIKGNIIKWWQQVRLPALHINNNNWNRDRKKNRNIDYDEETPETTPMAEEPDLSAETSSTQEGKPASSADGDAMEVLNRILHEKEWEIEKIRRQVQEEEQVASIMSANKVDVNAFIEEGRAAVREKEEDEKSAQEEENLKKAQAIIDRLNREAAEDEAKKQAEIDAAKQLAKETFG